MTVATAALITPDVFKRIEDVVVAIDFLVEEQVIGDEQSDLIFIEFMNNNGFDIDEYQDYYS